jgi:ubiquinone/menaquinone biosynthesis C-methylase UbiE
MNSSTAGHLDDQQADQPGPDSAHVAAEVMASYDRSAAEYAAQWDELRLERALHAFTSRITGQRRVLDLGCGPGRDLAFLTDLGCQLVGLDLSSGMLAQARIRLAGAQLVQADLRRLPILWDSFDGIWACASLLHLRRAHVPAALLEAKRVLRQPDGLLYLALKAGQGERWVTGHGGHRTFFSYFQPSEVQTMLLHTGFHCLDSWLDSDQAGRSEPWINAIASAGTG